jgi:hypothetical protein
MTQTLYAHMTIIKKEKKRQKYMATKKKRMNLVLPPKMWTPIP